jgi:phage protein U
VSAAGFARTTGEMLAVDAIKRTAYTGLLRPTFSPIQYAYVKLKNGIYEIEFFGGYVDVTKQHTIVSTAITGRSATGHGTVKEYISEADYTVTISGKLFTGDITGVFPVTDKRHDMPYNEIKRLNDVLSSTESLDVSNPYLVDMFGITKLAFKKCDFNQSGMKHLNCFSFKIEFVSDQDYNFLVEDI